MHRKATLRSLNSFCFAGGFIIILLSPLLSEAMVQEQEAFKLCHADGRTSHQDFSIRRSIYKHAGEGVFAERDFKAGELIMFFTGFSYEKNLSAGEEGAPYPGYHDMVDDLIQLPLLPINATHWHTVIPDYHLCRGLLPGKLNSHLYEDNNLAIGYYAAKLSEEEPKYKTTTSTFVFQVESSYYKLKLNPSIEYLWAKDPNYVAALEEISELNDDVGTDVIGEEFLEINDEENLVKQMAEDIIIYRYLSYKWPLMNSTHAPMIATRDIMKGEELFMDYTFTYWATRLENVPNALLRLLNMLILIHYKYALIKNEDFIEHFQLRKYIENKSTELLCSQLSSEDFEEPEWAQNVREDFTNKFRSFFPKAKLQFTSSYSNIVTQISQMLYSQLQSDINGSQMFASRDGKELVLNFVFSTAYDLFPLWCSHDLLSADVFLTEVQRFI